VLPSGKKVLGQGKRTRVLGDRRWLRARAKEQTQKKKSDRTVCDQGRDWGGGEKTVNKKK